MPTTPPSIDPTPTPAPQRADRSTFSGRVDAFVTWLQTGVTQIYNVALNCYNNSVEAYNSAGSSSASAAAATTQAGIAATQAGISTVQAGLSSASAAAAQQTFIDLQVLYDQFDDRYLGAKSSDPLVDNDGNALQNGAFYINTATGQLRAYTIAGGWAAGISAIAGVASVNGRQGDVATVSLSGPATAYVGQAIALTITDYNVFSTYVVQASAGSVSISGDQVSFTAPAAAQTVALTVFKDGVATSFSVPILPAGVTTPTNSSPSNGATNQNSTVTLNSSVFAWYGVADTHLNSDWQLSLDAGFVTVVQSTSADATNKTSWLVSGLSTSQTYYWRVRHRGTNNGVSAWSTGTNFATKSTFGGLIGTQGGLGFGVGEYPDTLPAGFSAMAGTSDPANANYGNYQYSDGSILVFVPRFYYRIGHASSPRYATYGANAIDIVGIDTYATEAAANTAGYAMHRAVKDGGADKSGFFIDKFLASKNGTTSCKSVSLGVPISLATDSANWTASNGMTGCTGILADAVVLARSRGAGVFNAASAFMYSALALLSLAHAQASSSTTYCAWYDATNNFPKGCNSGALADTNDAGVTYTTAGDFGSSSKPKTGSGSPFAKTTHNGQACGVADLNGCIYQCTLGVSNPGTGATDTTLQGNGDAYVLKTSVALSSLTAGWTSGASGTDAWGDAAHLGLLYDNVAGLFPWGATIAWTYFGNGANQVFSGATSGVSYQRTSCGIQDTTSGTSAGGTNQFGSDGCLQINMANPFVLSAGSWGGGASAGVFFRQGDYGWSADGASMGFRAGAYGS